MTRQHYKPSLRANLARKLAQAVVATALLGSLTPASSLPTLKELS